MYLKYVDKPTKNLPTNNQAYINASSSSELLIAHSFQLEQQSIHSLQQQFFRFFHSFLKSVGGLSSITADALTLLSNGRAPSYNKKMATSSSAAMKSALICVLLLAASVSGAHGYSVLCTNNTPKPLTCQGKRIPVGATVTVDVTVNVAIVVEVVDKAGNVVKGACVVPADVTALAFLYVGSTIQIKVTAVVTGLVGGLLNALLGLVLASIVVVL